MQRNSLFREVNGAAETGTTGPVVLEQEQLEPAVEVDREQARHQPTPKIESGVRRRYFRIQIGLAVTDALSIVLSLFVAYWIRWGTSLEVPYLLVMLLSPVVWLGIFKAQSLYSPQILSSWEEFRRMLTGICIGMTMLVFLNFSTRTYFSRLWIAVFAVLVTATLLVTRRAWRYSIHSLKKQGKLSLRTAIIGVGPQGGRLANALSTAASGFDLTGFIQTPSSQVQDECVLLGDIDNLPEVINEYGLDCLFVADPNIEQRDMIRIEQAARQQGVEIRLSANLPEILAPRLAVLPLAGIMTLSVKPVRLTGFQRAMKRVFDMVIASAGLLLLSPILVIVALGIKMNSRGPILFKQPRVTRGGRIFRMYKFRTMKGNADQMARENGIDVSVPFFKLGDEDPRVTSLGRVLRRTSLDELPQLFNVIKGEMSLVGPRPLPADQVAANLELLGPRHEVLAGVTGWWQIQGRSQIEDPYEAIRMDLFYIENWSLLLDLYILMKTFGVVSAGRGAV